MALEIEMGCRTRQAIMLLIRNSQDCQAEMRRAGLADRFEPEQYLKEYCTVRVAGPRQSGHTRAIADLRHELDRDQGMDATVAVTPVEACARRRGEDWPDFTPIRALDELPPADVIFVDNSFSLSSGTQAHVYAFAKRCLKRQGHVVIVLVQ